MVESDEEAEDEEECDGISDTWEDRTMEEPEEEGEFRPEKVEDPKQNTSGIGEIETPAESHDQRSSVNGTVRYEETIRNQENDPHNDGNQLLPNEVEESPKDTYDLKIFKIINSSNRCREGSDHMPIVATNENPTEVMDQRSGPGVQLVSMGCFGPFPNNMVFTTQNTRMNPDLEDEWPKNRKTNRRRVDSGGHNCSLRERPRPNTQFGIPKSVWFHRFESQSPKIIQLYTRAQ